jgi:hypothetical protein
MTIVTKVFPALALLALLPNTGLACSLYRSSEFHVDGIEHASAKPPRVGVRDVNFVPWISAGDSCDGVGFITIELSGPSARDTDSYGVLIQAQTGVKDEGLLPRYPLAPLRTYKGRVSVSLAWTGISRDADGHVRWRLKITPVSRSGVLGAPVSVCVASDDSCPRLVLDPP